ncbi:hypothetical protein [Nocardioides pyridinolyticus]
MFHDQLPLTPLVTHLVFVDGRLVDTWQEPAIGTEWARHARPSPPPPAPPPPPPHERAATWLAAVCGGREAVESLDGDPLTDDAIDLPVEYELTSWRQRMESTAEILDSVAGRLFDAETSFAFRHALLALWADDTENVTRPVSPAHLAGGICWAVGRANGLFHPVGPRRVGATQVAFGLRTPLSGPGNAVAAALRGFRPQADPWGRPTGAPDLLALGRPDLLLGATRERLLRLRTRVREAEAAA